MTTLYSNTETGGEEGKLETVHVARILRRNTFQLAQQAAQGQGKEQAEVPAGRDAPHHHPHRRAGEPRRRREGQGLGAVPKGETFCLRIEDQRLNLQLDDTGEEEVQEGVDPEPEEQDGRVHPARVPAARHVEAAQVRDQHRGFILHALRLHRRHQRHRLWKRYVG